MHIAAVKHSWFCNLGTSSLPVSPRNPILLKNKHVVLCSLQKTVRKGDECILKDNNERSKWLVTGPGGVDMLVPSVSLIIPPPNPLAVDLATKWVAKLNFLADTRWLEWIQLRHCCAHATDMSWLLKEWVLSQSLICSIVNNFFMAFGS